MSLRQLKPELESRRLLGVARSEAKKLEFNLPIGLPFDGVEMPVNLMALVLGILGDVAALAAQQFKSGDLENEFDQNTIARIRFCARFLDSYALAKYDPDYGDYFAVLGSAAYYLSDSPGNAKVISRLLVKANLDVEGGGIENLIAFCLTNEILPFTRDYPQYYESLAKQIQDGFADFYMRGSRLRALRKAYKEIHELIYAQGSARELLLVDLLGGILQAKARNSSWRLLPLYSGVEANQWGTFLNKPQGIRELWPSQRSIGEQGVLSGNSAIIQMPTSAGKTRSLELLIRSLFLRTDSSTVVIVAPFRALCNEIRQEFVRAFRGEAVDIDGLTDVTQMDFTFDAESADKRILISTPEKLLFVIRQEPEFAASIDLIAYDEGHQFDAGIRGVTYELLLTAVKSQIPETTQVVLISAVITNASVLGSWLMGSKSRVVSSSAIHATMRSVALVSYRTNTGESTQEGWLKYLNEDNLSEVEFWTPGIITATTLEKVTRERIPRTFPESDDPQSIGMYLGTRLVTSGEVAIFCGRKDSVVKMCRVAMENVARGWTPFSAGAAGRSEEIAAIAKLYEENLGGTASCSKAAKYGIFSHHGNTPQGIRYAIEHAMRHSLIKFVICTSTLAQGVNLPIRYLIITSAMQGGDEISVRDFHNLMGRAGRAGMHTEGSIIFANPAIYDRRRFDNKGRWRWESTMKLLKPENSEPCKSSLLLLFEPFQSDDGQYQLAAQPVEFTRRYLAGDTFDDLRIPITIGSESYKFERIEPQIREKGSIIKAIQSYILEYTRIESDQNSVVDLIKVAEQTLAHFLSSEVVQKEIVEIFRIIGEDVLATVTDVGLRRVFSKTLLGLKDAISLNEWVVQHADELAATSNSRELLLALWTPLSQLIQCAEFRKCSDSSELPSIANLWLKGESYFAILQYLIAHKIKLLWGPQQREFKIEQVVELCDRGFSFELSQLIGAVCELIRNKDEFAHMDLISRINHLQRQLKYGLENHLAMKLYEKGFGDRVIAAKMEQTISKAGLYATAESGIKANKHELETLLEDYPDYFKMLLDQIAN